jgi:hypothetical protein
MLSFNDASDTMAYDAFDTMACTAPFQVRQSLSLILHYYRNLLNEHAAEAQAIVYVIDSAVFNKDVRTVAELLYTVLIHPSLADVPVLVSCNKQVCSKSLATLEAHVVHSAHVVHM